MTIIKISKNELFDISLRKFKRLCEKSGILSELKRREFYEKPSEKRKRIKNYKKKLFNRKKLNKLK